MSEVKRTLKQEAFHEAREYFLISLYLFVVFSLFVIYKWVILAEDHIDFALHGFALFNALALAKVVLVAQGLHLGDQYRDAPLVYPTLLKSFVFTILLVCFKIVEETAMGILHGKSFHDSAVLSRWSILEGGINSRVLVLRYAYSVFWLHRVTASFRRRQVSRRLFPLATSAERAAIAS